jgi:hypothetical protein
MFRRAFRKSCRILAVESARLAVPPLLFRKRGNVLLLAFVLVPIALGSPITGSQAGLPHPTDIFLKQPLTADAIQTNTQELHSRSDFPLSSLAPVPITDEAPTQSLESRSTGLEKGEGYECYPYLLLTAGLILLAFRPAGPAMAGRY